MIRYAILEATQDDYKDINVLGLDTYRLWTVGEPVELSGALCKVLEELSKSGWECYSIEKGKYYLKRRSLFEDAEILAWRGLLDKY